MTWAGLRGTSGVRRRPPVERARIRDRGAWLRVEHVGSIASPAADELATQLGRMATPTPTRSASTGGLAITLRVDASLEEDFRVGPTSTGAELVGRTADDLDLAVWSVLRALGHQQLGTTAEWERVPVLGAVVDLPPIGSVRRPWSFLHGLGDGCGVLASQRSRLDSWRTRVGIGVDRDVYTGGHTWGLFITQTAPPIEWRSTSGNKLHVEIPALVAAFVAWTIPRAAGKRWTSVAAADGTAGWSEIPTSPSNAQVVLANACAAAGLSVSILAYGSMSAAPTIPLDPRVLVVVASAFMADGYTVDSVRAGYEAAGARLFAVYEYPHVWTFTPQHDLPAGQRVNSRSDLGTVLERGLSAVGWDGEGSPAWGPCGRWYSGFAVRQSGDLRRVPLVEWDTYPRRVFPSAPELGAAWYGQLDRREPFGFGAADSTALRAAARALILGTPIGSTERVRALDCGRYAVWCDLWRVYWYDDRTAPRLEAALRWACRIRERDLVSYRCPYFDPVLAAHRATIAAGYSLADLSPFAPVWPDANSEPPEAEVLALL